MKLMIGWTPWPETSKSGWAQRTGGTCFLISSTVQSMHDSKFTSIKSHLHQQIAVDIHVAHSFRLLFLTFMFYSEFHKFSKCIFLLE